jgi:glycosyltransferase involved in cell wall biosynthesis
MTMQKEKRIAIIIPGGIGTGRDNIGVPVLEQQVKLLACRFDVVVFSLFKVNEDYHADGFEIVSISGKSFPLKAIRLFNAFRKFNGRKKFDVIHGFWALPCGFFAVTLAKYFGSRSMVSVLGGDAISLPQIGYGQLRKFVPKNLVRWTVKNADCVTALTRFLAENLRRAHITRSDIQIIPWGIDNHQFAHTPIAISYPIQILHIGNFSPVKDQLTMLQAFRILSDKVDCRLTIIGEGTLQQELETWIHSNNLADKVTIKPPVPYEELSVFYKRAMVLLHTSLSEGQSEVVTEAMSAGVIVCGTRVGLLYDFPELCVAVPVKEPDTLAKEVLRLIKDEKRIDAMRKAAKDWAYRYNMAWTVERTGDLYRNY